MYAWLPRNSDLKSFFNHRPCHVRVSAEFHRQRTKLEFQFCTHWWIFQWTEQAECLVEKWTTCKVSKSFKKHLENIFRSRTHQGLNKNPNQHTWKAENCIPEARNALLRLLVTNILIGCSRDVILTAVISCKAVPHRDLIIFVFIFFASMLMDMQLWKCGEANIRFSPSSFGNFSSVKFCWWRDLWRTFVAARLSGEMKHADQAFEWLPGGVVTANSVFNCFIFSRNSVRFVAVEFKFANRLCLVDTLAWKRRETSKIIFHTISCMK